MPNQTCNFIFKHLHRLMLLCCVVASLVHAENKLRNVVLLHSYHKGMLWADEVVDGMLDILGKPEIRVDLHVEYMDTRRFTDPEQIEIFKQLLKRKFLPGYLQAVIIADDPALYFFLKNREELFPDLPAVFCGINFANTKFLAAQENLTGVIEGFDLAATLQMGLQLFPQTREWVIINDRSRTGIANRTRLNQLFPLPTHPEVQARFLEILGIEELEDTIRQLPSTSLILLLTYNFDGYGDFYRYREVVDRVRQASAVPVFGVWSFYMGRGILGGNIFDGRQHGRNTASKVLQILEGKPAARIPIDTLTQGNWVFDYREMQHFGISQEQLPAESYIVYKPQTLWESHRNLILIGASSLLLLGGLVIMLAIALFSKAQIEKKQMETEAHLRAIFDQSFQLSTTLDLQGNIIDANRTALEFAGIERLAVLGKPLWEGPWFAEDKGGCLNVQQSVAFGSLGKTSRFEVFHRDSRGALLTVDFSLRPIFNEHGSIIFLVAEGVDITQRKRSEAALDLAVRELKIKNRDLEQILYVASHDLRSPLVNIQGYSKELGNLLEELAALVPSNLLNDLVQEKFERLRQKDIPDSLSFILRGVRKMDTLISGLLRIARLGKQSLRIQVLDMNALVSNVVLLQKFRLQQTGLSVECENLPECPGDAVQINQVFSNLLDNAIKYRDPQRSKSITIGGKFVEDFVCYWMQDDGIGICPEHQPKIFEIFHRLNPSDSDGEGIGLNIVQRILERHGGHLKLQSEPLVGSRFEIYLPIKAVS